MELEPNSCAAFNSVWFHFVLVVYMCICVISLLCGHVCVCTLWDTYAQVIRYVQVGKTVWHTCVCVWVLYWCLCVC